MTKGFSLATIAAAFGQTPAYCVQVAASTVLFLICGTAFDRLKLKSKL
jgi:hypothetical protein